MTVSVRLILAFTFIFALAFIGCSDDPVTPEDHVYMEVELTFPQAAANSDSAFVVELQSNRPITEARFVVDGEIQIIDDTAPFQFFWNIALWADGRNHVLYAYGYDSNGDRDAASIHQEISENAKGILQNPAPGSGIYDIEAVPLRWHREPQASETQVEISLMPDLSNPRLSTTTNETTAVIAAAPQEWHYWRVRQREGDNEWGSWSETSAFFGGQVFDQSYPYLNGHYSVCHAVIQLSDGNYIAAGKHVNTYSKNPKSGFFPVVRCVNPLGKQIWNYEPYFQGSYRDLVLTDNGECVLVGSADNHLLISRISSDGQEIWNRAFFGEDSYASCIQECSSGGFIVSGLSNGNAYLLRVNENGRLIWEKSFAANNATAVVESPDGGFVLTSTTVQNMCAVLIGTDSQGELLWQTTLCGVNKAWASPCVDLVYNGAGYTVLDEVDGLHFFNISGDHESTTWLEHGNYTTLERTLTGNYHVLGNSILYCLDEAGLVLWDKTLGGTPLDFVQTSDNGFIIAGEKLDRPHGQEHFWLLKTDLNAEYAPPESD